MNSDGRVLLDEEEVAGTQVVVACVLAGVDGGDVDGRLDGRVAGVLGGDDGHIEGLELSTDLADREMANLEGNLGVSRLQFPGADGVLGVKKRFSHVTCKHGRSTTIPKNGDMSPKVFLPFVSVADEGPHDLRCNR